MYTHPFDTSIFDIITITPGNPSAGNNLVFAPNTQTRIQIISVLFTFTSDANAANRAVRLIITDGSDTFFIAPPDLVQVASQGEVYCFSVRGGSAYSSGDALTHSIPLPPNLWIRDTGSVESLITNIQVGDALTNPAIRFIQQPLIP